MLGGGYEKLQVVFDIFSAISWKRTVAYRERVEGEQRGTGNTKQHYCDYCECATFILATLLRD